MGGYTAEYFRELLSYDPLLGEFRWRVARGQRFKAGTLAGTVGFGGYLVIGVDRKYYRAHRLALMLMNGQWPAGVVDHINGVKTDNRFENLRECTQAQNSRNQRRAKSNRSGYKGVYWYSRNRRWVASIRLDRKLIHLGYFDSPIDAAYAYNEASLKYHGVYGRPSLAMLSPKPAKAGKVRA